jgi:hypothetical protein
MSVVSLRQGEELVAVAVSDTMRWIVGVTFCWTWGQTAHEPAGQAYAQRSQDESGTDDQPAHLPDSTDLDRKGLHSVRILGLAKEPHILAAPGTVNTCRRASRRRSDVGENPIPLHYHRQQSTLEAAICVHPNVFAVVDGCFLHPFTKEFVASSKSSPRPT